MKLLQVYDVSKVYQGAVPCEALRKIDLSVNEGEFVSIMGPSGSGKTTLLNLLATIDQPSTGQIMIDGKNPNVMNKEELALFRRRNLGFVFQDFNLLETLTIEENIMLPLTLDRVAIGDTQRRTEAIMKTLDISEIKAKRIFEISGGEAQRVAIARALIHRPKLILADEPTGNLDSKAAGSVMELLTEFNEERHVTTLMVTHDAVSASYSRRVIFIKDGAFYNEIYCGEDRELFYQKILAVLAHLGGTNHAFQASRFH